jgi:hypothetical protein
MSPTAAPTRDRAAPADSATLVTWLGGKEADAEQGAGQVEQPLEQVGAPLIADAQAAIAEQPGKRAFDHPAVPPESLAGVYAAASNAWRDATSPEGTPQG